MALAYSRSRVLCAAARLGVADALGDEVRDLDFLSKTCQADADALYRLLRALASLGVTEETAPKQFRLTVVRWAATKRRASVCVASRHFLWGSTRRLLDLAYRMCSNRQTSL